MQSKDNQSQAPIKKPYTSPELIIYGNVAEITQGGGLNSSQPLDADFTTYLPLSGT
ncbi:MAG: lasso RiPP family leader peptide-containing protein [Aphanothece sp. CMT-3BRIN-NPC111]|jgi:hypothetical protein|nr:lasso RiPP family leader peptide-containing protein [Aphanothece sp. CMT-3BRIN-NPC111]